MRLFQRLRIMMVVHSPERLGKLARQAEVRIWVDGSEAFPRLEYLIRHAKHSVVVQMFIWKDDRTGRRVASSLLEAADRGVMVHITKEAIGDFFEAAGDFLGTRNSELPLWRRFWSHPNIRIVHGSHGDHAKVYVIDEEIFLLTGMNLADEYDGPWHDYMVELRGSHFVERYLARVPDGEQGESVRIVMNTEEEKGVRPVLMKLLSEAKESLIVEHCYVSDDAVLDALLEAARRGVSVTVIMPERTDLHHYANLQSVGRLVSEGAGTPLRVLLYPDMFHGKIVMADYDTAFLGSANLMSSSLDDMGEVNVLIRGKYRALWKLQETLRQDAFKSRAVSSPPSLLWLSKILAWIGL